MQRSFSKNVEMKKAMINREDVKLSLKKQCEFVGLNRSTFYYKPAPESNFNLHLMKLIDEEFTRHPFYGYRSMTTYLRRKGYQINKKRIAHLMKLMGLQAIHPGPKTSKQNPGHKKYPYLLGNLDIYRPNQVWCADITYIPMSTGFCYLIAIMDWYSRYVLSWEVSNSMDVSFCQSSLRRALRVTRPDIFNTDQGSQFTSHEFTDLLLRANVQISMDGRGRFLDNIFIERLWRTVKYQEVYLHEYRDVTWANSGISKFLLFYNNERPHQSLNNATPAEVYLTRR